MPRRKPTSLTAKKASLKLKRAVKRGEASPPPPAPAQRRKRPGHPSRPPAPGRERDEVDEKEARADEAKAAARRLESSFLKPSPSYLALSAQRASTAPLRRPIPASAAHFPRELLSDPGGPSEPQTQTQAEQQRPELTCPKRPKWRYGMTKKEVERNEEGVFAKWRAETEARFAEWQRAERERMRMGPEGGAGAVGGGPSYCEWNLEVWRQLWRVTELSDILLLLLDARCPPLHYPRSLEQYLLQLKPARKLVLVLTKVDVVGHERAARWAAWLRARFGADAEEGGVRVVMVESYRAKLTPAMNGAPDGGKGKARPGPGRRRAVEPHLPTPFRHALVQALKEAHEELKRPPAHVRDDEQKLRGWKCRVRAEVDWEGVERALGSGESISGSARGGAGAEREMPPAEDVAEEREGKAYDAEPEYLTIGLIGATLTSRAGQPNVGKSSLLNALFGRPRVRASRTPGKTKHFQTLFLSPQVRLVDCPGLVLPAYVHMELQALAGVLPIAQMASLPSCVSYALSLLPLERVLRLQMPAEEERSRMEGKRTWRAERPAPQIRAQGTASDGARWTAMAVLEAYALDKGWITAKAGRPDTGRAGNAIMRALAEARIPWAFMPPAGDGPVGVGHGLGEGDGIWLGGEHVAEGLTDGESTGYDTGEEEEDGEEVSEGDERASGEDDEDEDEDEHGEGEQEEDDSGAEEVGRAVRGLKFGGGFAALALEDEESPEEDDDADDAEREEEEE
ncbi:hypothetical protein CALCODRAFT_510367 [Calocera cornea HHB12733]|uniref:Guanine nucleotide-binding protein-like 1 n=1 Tax=Calocera cornea HHB12733 TaxID=1353952 RepID=A0A165EK73_9BASI|nr:hypothetical protein CALCODRAFT_510367 [Calocera cornea HHB12733]